MQIKSWVFRPGWASTLVVLLLLPLLLTLGFWQLDRGQQKAGLQTAFADQAGQPPVTLAEADLGDSAATRYQRVTVFGHYDGARQILLDNQVRGGQPGYHVLTPLRLPEGGAILINRGWIPLGESRQVLPTLIAPTEAVKVTGWLAQPAQPGLKLGDAAGADRRWPRVVPYVDYDRLATVLAYPLHPAVVLLEPEAASGFERDWQPRFGGFGPERHQGYAVQWFSLAAALVILYLSANLRRLPSPE
ncbi:MAG: SURF1 family protein [Synechococcaceae cyanobacterium SM1_2_3]|nr:SURF1 family protein [Synechococcaceae cyanobacterium SM1_2_3]